MDHLQQNCHCPPCSIKMGNFAKNVLSKKTQAACWWNHPPNRTPPQGRAPKASPEFRGWKFLVLEELMEPIFSIENTLMIFGISAKKNFIFKHLAESLKRKETRSYGKRTWAALVGIIFPLSIASWSIPSYRFLLAWTQDCEGTVGPSHLHLEVFVVLSSGFGRPRIEDRSLRFCIKAFYSSDSGPP